MHLLVSVASAREARAGLEGGADLIDAKNPRAGALGAVSPAVLAEIAAEVGGARPVTAALGDAADETAIEQTARLFASAGVAYVKVGFGGIGEAARVRSLIEAAARGCRNGPQMAGVVAVAYADACRAGSLGPRAMIAVAAAAGAEGLLIDTADKNGPGLRGLIEPDTLAGWVEEAHLRGLFAALAGKLTAKDIDIVRDAGADIAGVRGAACEGGRLGRVTAARVAALRLRAGHSAGASFRSRGPSAGPSSSIRSAGTIVHRTPSGRARMK